MVWNILEIIENKSQLKRFIKSYKLSSKDKTLIGFDLNIVNNFKKLRKLLTDNQHYTTIKGVIYFHKTDLPETILFWCTNK